MNVTDCLLVGLLPHACDFVPQAARLAFPQAALTAYNSVVEASQRQPGSVGELLILANPDAASIRQAVGALDAAGLRRWAIVVIGEASSTLGVEIVGPQELDGRSLARVFQSAVAQHQLFRMSQCTQGDLRTVASRISHDLRTPLGGIVSACEAMKESLAEQGPVDASLIAPIFNSTDEVSRLVERVSYVLRASVMPVEKKILPMTDPVWAALQRLERQIAKTNASVTQPDSWPEVSGVERMLETIWLNLLGNALQHSGQRPRIELGWSVEPDNCRFWVRDVGPGVPATMRAKLFQPFNTLYETNASRGLGLSITERLVRLQGGSCGYQPVASGGSQFSFTLPST